MKFAHLSDIHLGFQKHESLQKIEQQVFEKAMDECISRKVDFILIPGDMFHVNIPEMRVQKYAFSKFRQVYDAGIPVYVVYGSHDFSPVSNSVIDLLAEVGYIIKVTKATSNEDGTISLDFLVDEKTGAKIAGLSGLKVGKDREWYEKLDRVSLESESGFKIFLFHGGISDMKTESGMDGDHMPLSLLPKGFSYYAGGHMHKWNHQKFEDYPHVVYPGTPFAGFHADLEENAKGQKRGFVLVEFEDDVKSVEFVELKNTRYEMIEIDADNRKADSINQELVKKTKNIDPADKVVIIKVAGELTSGKTADVDLSSIREKLAEAGSLVVNISKNRLTSKEYSITEAKGANKEEVETNIFSENIGQLRFDHKELLGEEGIKLAKKLLHELGQGQLVNEKKNEYIPRIRNNALAILGLDKDDS
ncbi:DNA double-strand break repair protein Mre11 [Marine Group I thaumarchaeote SCGC RSA3]|uniref:DNA double-strand break repair protein Mre11 n=2 Tax=Marine Group I TaxID=905826 RepID=A0A081RP01_9ARCH|nr:DNA double-strand break repair protein Mre11 [Marine Group I thaumarchaeote SCGC AAA799-N04]KFM17410.1 DNA double-strand break repair protein Mre11 [Marine Group I thaumarchaeote SCGC RSA3]